MKKIIGVRFREAAKSYFFDPKDLEIHPGDRVIVDTARGVDIGKVIYNREVDESEIKGVLKDVIRVATEEDIERDKENRIKEKDAYRICKEKIREYELEMKLVRAEYSFDNGKLLFYFTADGRVDFRELVKALAAIFHTRIELRQIGVRDETKVLGGIGVCGRPLCCATYLTDFAPVSIKMAKEQNLSLNPTKISGVCGRLMCCLKNEEETYEYLNSMLPRINDEVTSSTGEKGIVQSVNVLRQKVKVVVEQDDVREVREYDVSELTFKPRKKKGQPQEETSEESQAEPKEQQPAKEKEEKTEGQENGGGEKKRNNHHRGHNGRNNKNRKHQPKSEQNES